MTGIALGTLSWHDTRFKALFCLLVFKQLFGVVAFIFYVFKHRQSILAHVLVIVLRFGSLGN